MSTPGNWTRHPSWPRPRVGAARDQSRPGLRGGAGCGTLVTEGGAHGAGPAGSREASFADQPVYRGAMATPNQPGVPVGTTGWVGTGTSRPSEPQPRPRPQRPFTEPEPAQNGSLGRGRAGSGTAAGAGAIRAGPARARPRPEQAQPFVDPKPTRMDWAGGLREAEREELARQDQERRAQERPERDQRGGGPDGVSRSWIRSRPGWTGRPISASTTSCGGTGQRPGAAVQEREREPATAARSRPPGPRPSSSLRPTQPTRLSQTSCLSAARKTRARWSGQRGERGQRGARGAGAGARAAPGAAAPGAAPGSRSSPGAGRPRPPPGSSAAEQPQCEPSGPAANRCGPQRAIGHRPRSPDRRRAAATAGDRAGDRTCLRRRPSPTPGIRPSTSPRSHQGQDSSGSEPAGGTVAGPNPIRM